MGSAGGQLLRPLFHHIHPRLFFKGASGVHVQLLVGRDSNDGRFFVCISGLLVFGRIGFFYFLGDLPVGL